MTFKPHDYIEPDFSKLNINATACYSIADQDGIAPDNYHAMSIYPEYFNIDGEWILPNQSRMDCVAILRDKKIVDIVEFRNIKKGDKVILGRTEDGSEGIYLHADCFVDEKSKKDTFGFRQSRTRETAFSKDYDKLYDVLKHDKDNGHIVWVLGPAVVFDHDSRNAFVDMIGKGYVDGILAGNALATHDMEGDLFRTALGQDIYTQNYMHNGHYNHLDLINRVRKAGSIEEYCRNTETGIINACVESNVPYVLAGSIRDDGPLPGVYDNCYKAQDAMRDQLRKATCVVCLATQLHTIASGNMTPSYTIKDGVTRPVYIYYVDIAEFAANKLKDRGSLSVTTIITNVQDFLSQVDKNI